jgi:hypothetical protein
MRFIRDGAADETVRNDKRLQDHIHARTVILWLPGMSAGVAVQGLLMFAGAGIAISALWFGSIDAERFKYFVFAVVLGSIPMAMLFNALVRGVSSARTWMFRLSLAHSFIAALETLAFLILGRSISAVVASIGFVLSLMAARLVAGASYALLAAIYRAQRMRLQSPKPGTEQIANR